MLPRQSLEDVDSSSIGLGQYRPKDLLGDAMEMVEVAHPVRADVRGLRSRVADERVWLERGQLRVWSSFHLPVERRGEVAELGLE